MRPVHLVFVILFFQQLFAACAPSIDFVYQLDWGGDRFCVSLVYTPAQKGQDTLYYGSLEFGGQADIFGCIKNLTVEGAAYTADSANRQLVLDVTRMKPISLYYEVACRLPDEGINCPSEMFRPNITDDFFYCHGVNLFFRHSGKVAKSETQRITWGKTPDFPSFCMYNPEDSFETVTGPASDFHSTLLIGDRSLNIDTITVCNTENYVVTAPRKNAEYNRTAIAQYFAEFYQGIAQFWEEDTLETYSLVIYPFEKIPFNASGTGLNHGFCSRYNAAADTVLTKERINLFSHEIGHNWISADMDNQWFGEGFNEFQTNYMLVAVGIEPPASFVEYFNNSLGKLYHSKIRNIPNDSISIHFWELGDYSWIAYWRGLVYAFRLWGQMENNTNNVNCYKELMIALKDNCAEMTKEKFFPVAEKFLDRQLLEEEFEKYIIRGETIPLEQAQMPSGIVLRTKVDGTPYIEIADEAAFKAHFTL